MYVDAGTVLEHREQGSCVQADLFPMYGLRSEATEGNVVS